MTKKTLIPALIPATLGLLLALGASTAFSACDRREDGTWMHCHQCQNSVVAGAVGVAAVFGASAFVRNRAMRIAMQILGVLASILLFFIPGGLCPMCMMRTMRCYTVFQPFTRVMSSLVALSGLLALVPSFKAKRIDS